MSKYIFKNSKLLPDFIIAGAMKSGTTFLHNSLNNHSKIFLPKSETPFFDDCNINLKRAFFLKNKSWIYNNFEDNYSYLWDNYVKNFSTAKGILNGSDAPSYFISKEAPELISKQKKEIKIIFILRHPTERTFSEYNYAITRSRGFLNFENSIMKDQSLIEKSLYIKHLKHWLKFIPRDRIKIVVFEDLIKNPELVFKSILNFLGLKYEDSVLSNKSKKTTFYHKYNRLRFFKNYLFYGNHFTIIDKRFISKYTKDKISVKESLKFRIFAKIHDLVNTKILTKPKIHKNTKIFLDNYFMYHLRDIDNVTSLDIYDNWFKNKL